MQRQTHTAQGDPSHGRRPGGGFLAVIAFLLALAGLMVSGSLLYKHVGIQLGQKTLVDPFCEDEAEDASCTDVITGPWGEMFGQPTAYWGFVFFAAMTSWYLAVGRPIGTARAWNLLPFFGAAAGAAACGYFFYIMHYKLGEFCRLCFATHVLAAALLLMAFVILIVSLVVGRRVIETRHMGQRLLTAIVLALVTSALGWSEYHRRLEAGQVEHLESRLGDLEEYESDFQEYYAQFAGQERKDIPVGENDSLRGNPDAPHAVVVFSDFQCPACRLAHKMIETQLEAHPDFFRVVFKHFPFDRNCNPHVKRTLHPAACAAAVSAEAARKVEGDDAFWAFHDAFFEHQNEFPKRIREFVNETAEAIGITEEQLWENINTRSAWDRIHTHRDQGHKLGVDRTPSIFFDGRPMTRWADPLFWRYLTKVDERAGAPVIPPDTQPAGTQTAPATAPSEEEFSPEGESAAEAEVLEGGGEEAAEAP